MANRKNLDERIEAAKIEAEQKQNRVKELLKQQKAQGRKERNHRLCKRGGQVESLLPGLEKLTDKQFEIFVERTLLNSHTKSVLAELLPAETTEKPDVDVDAALDGESAATPHADAAARPDAAPAPKKPEAATLNPGANINGKPAPHNGGNNNHRPAQAAQAPTGAGASKTGNAPRVAS